MFSGNKAEILERATGTEGLVFHHSIRDVFEVVSVPE
jgi:hypothetical protein